MEKLDDKKRIAYIDIAKGIGILLMIAGHVFYYGIYKKIIFSFHMPLFVIISGMFFKYNKNFKEYLLKIIKRLLIPYTIGVTVVSLGRNILKSENIQIIPQILLGFSNFKSIFVDVETVGVLWFIPYLIWVKILYYFANLEAENNDFLLGIGCSIMMGVGFYFRLENGYLPWSFDIAISTVILFYVGNMIIKHKLIEKIIKNNKILFLCLTIWIIGFLFIELEFARRVYSILGFVIAFCGCMVVLKISYIIDKYFKLLGNFLKWCGKNSIYILIVHYFEYEIFKYTGNDLEIFAKKMLFILVVTFGITFFRFIVERLITKIKEINLVKNNPQNT